MLVSGAIFRPNCGLCAVPIIADHWSIKLPTDGVAAPACLWGLVCSLRCRLACAQSAHEFGQRVGPWLIGDARLCSFATSPDASPTLTAALRQWRIPR